MWENTRTHPHAHHTHTPPWHTHTHPSHTRTPPHTHTHTHPTHPHTAPSSHTHTHAHHPHSTHTCTQPTHTHHHPPSPHTHTSRSHYSRWVIHYINTSLYGEQVGVSLGLQQHLLASAATAIKLWQTGKTHSSYAFYHVIKQQTGLMSILHHSGFIWNVLITSTNLWTNSGQLQQTLFIKRSSFMLIITTDVLS